MSIENNIARIADALETLVAAVNTQTQVQADPMVSALQAIAKVIEVQSHGTITHSSPVPVHPVVAVSSPNTVPAVDTGSTGPVSVPVHTEPAAQPAVVVEAPKPALSPVVIEVAQPVAAPVAPAAASPTSAPFRDAKGLVEYVMSAYKALGPIRGGLIQGALDSIGHTNINNVRPDQYGEFFAKVEALKAGA